MCKTFILPWGNNLREHLLTQHPFNYKPKASSKKQVTLDSEDEPSEETEAHCTQYSARSRCELQYSPPHCQRQTRIVYSERPVARKESPLSRWKKNERRLPNLAKVAHGILRNPATSTPSEWMFSIAQLTVTKLCSCRKPSNVDALNKDILSLLCFLGFFSISKCSVCVVLISCALCTQINNEGWYFRRLW